MKRKLWQSEWAVLGVVVFCVLSVEGVLSLTRASLSEDIRHIDDVPRVLDEVIEGDGERILLWGNSLIREGVDMGSLQEVLEGSLGQDVTVGAVHPDGTTPLEWDYLARRVLLPRQQLPDVVIVGFGPGHLGDRPAGLVVLPLAVHHVATEDIGRLLSEEFLDIESRSQFLLARASLTFGFRDRVSSRVLSTVIPYYRALAGIFLSGGAAAGEDLPRADSTTYGHIDFFLGALRAADVTIYAVPMPALEENEIGPSLEALFRKHLVTLIDLNPVDGLGPERFRDGEHLDSLGREVFTQALAKALVEETVR